MVLYFMATEGSAYFPTPAEKTEAAIARFREVTRQALCDTTLRINLKDVLGTAWRSSLRLALITHEDERGTASEVLGAFSRGTRGLVSTVSKTRGMEYVVQKLAVISENQQEVLRRTGTIAGNVDRVLQEQLDLRRRVAAMSTVLGHLAMDEMRMPHTFLVLPEKQSRFPRPKQWFADRGRLRFVCAHCLELVPCGKDGTGFLVSQPKVRCGVLQYGHREAWCIVEIYADGSAIVRLHSSRSLVPQILPSVYATDSPCRDMCSP